MLAVDASLAVELALDRIGESASVNLDRGGELIAPPLLWSEVPSALHEMSFRDEISDALAELALQRFLSGRLSIDERRPDGHAAAAWAVADELVGRRPTTPITSRRRRLRGAASSPSTAGCGGERIVWASSLLRPSSLRRLVLRIGSREL
ncbi:MAG TPA: hypothetical protein VGH14_21710 [Solirubrobacterales bacterium]|jgi:hypothetical protein